jgi:TPR repeat protein
MAGNARAAVPAASITAQQAKALELQAEKGMAATNKLLKLPGSANDRKIVRFAKTFGLQRYIIHYNKLAVHWWSLAAKQDYIPALDRLAIAYYEGKGAQQLYVVAMQLWREAAKRGDEEGQADLAECYRHGWGTASSPSKAAFWMKKAAAQGFEFALYHLGNWYAGGYGVKKSQHEALTCWKKAAALGGPIANAAEARINAVSTKSANPPAKP